MSFKAINDYFINFLTENGDNDFVSLWKSQQKEFKEFINKTVPQKTKKNKDKNAPIRNQNAYMFFCKDARVEIKAKNPTIDSKEILREMGKRWNLLKEKNPKKAKEYEAKAAADKERYSFEKENYTAPESGTEEEEVPKEES
jgi:hypothetical protein